MLKKYEGGIIFDPEIAETGIESEMSNIEKEITSAGGLLVHKESWGKRNFAYPIKKKKEGYYCFFYYQTQPSAHKKIEEALRTKQNILRSLFVIKKSLPETPGKEENAGT
jgi:small subunit ribosomal protein S6